MESRIGEIIVEKEDEDENGEEIREDLETLQRKDFTRKQTKQED